MNKFKAKKNKQKNKKNKIFNGIVYINSSFNNTIISVTDSLGNVLGWSTSGSLGFKGSKKSTPFASQLSSEKCIEKVISNYGLQTVDIKVSGPGPGRESAIRSIHNAGLIIKSIIDVTPIPHNGCRPSKRRRV